MACETAELEAYLHERIPLSRAMQVSVLEVGEAHLRVGAPLAPNINHRNTVFGGSAAAAAMLAAWGLLYVRLRRERRPARLVIQRSSLEFLQPIDDLFTATSRLAAPDAWPRFLATLERKGRSRIAVEAVLDCRGVAVARFQGEFVALRLEDGSDD
jgi:thioesterase domain-containing protein